ncbi:MAG: SIS domain-containing protein, partial [Alphaproteobacteria bacterium]
HVDVVGRGPGLGTALYGALVLRELLGLRGGWMPAGHFRHGPLLDVAQGHKLIVIAGGRTAALGARLAADAAGRGGRAVLVTDRAPDAVPGVLTVSIPVKDELLFALLAALPFELYMAEAARTVGTAYLRVQTTSE